MTKIYKLMIFLSLVFSGESFAQICNPSGNLVIYSNYDGGIININCDVNIPNLKIGICTYEAAEIHIIGTFSNNVTGIIYAGYDGNNDNCNLGVTATSIIGSSSQTINPFPLVGSYNPVHGNGYMYMDGCYQCDTTISSGGVNSPDEVVFYFLNEFPGSVLRSHHTQYGCWTPTTFNLSAGGNCCIMPAGSNPCVPPPTPTDITVAANQNICAGGTATLAVNSNTTVNWFATNTSTTIIGVGTSYISNTLTVGNYTFYAAAVNSCSASVRVPISVTVNPLPVLTLSASTLGICLGQHVDLMVGGANTYSWSTGATTSSISITPSVTLVYSVTGTSLLGCKSTATVIIQVVNCTGLDDITSSTIQFNIFPNPAKNILNITSQSGEKKIRIMDIMGKQIYAKETEESDLQIDVNKLSKGIYIFTIHQNGKVKHEKLIVE